MLLVLVSAITLALVAERIIFAWVCLLFHLFNQGPDRKSTWFIGTLVQNVTSLIGSAVTSVARLFSFSLRGLLIVSFILIIWAFAFICARYSSEGLLAFQRVYNSSTGGAFRLVFVLPVQLLQLLWDACIPIYNLMVYCVKTIPTRILLENVLRNVSNFESSMFNFALFVQALVKSLVDYVDVIMSPPDSFDPNLRLLDLITPLSYWRLTVSYMLAWLGDVCSVASSLGDIIAYPFLDINFGLGMHNLINSVLTLAIQVPTVTTQRCKAGGGAMVYCIPDFEPVVELAVNGVRRMGFMFDNWLDVVAIIIQSVLTNTSPACTGWTVVNFLSKDGLMGVNETVIVGIDDNHFAKTDGWNIEVYSRTNVQGFPSAFPSQMNVNYGVAIVSVTSEIKGLMGCACVDQNYGMQIVCAVAPMDALTPSFYVPVEFNVPTTSFYMGCAKSKIRLDSIRWPVTRSTSPNSNARGSLTAQAALYVRPMCSSEWTDIVCLETFKLANCFPYCMALWTKNYIGSMVLRSGAEWANTVAMGRRDCGLHSWDLRSGDLVSVTNTLRQNSGVKSTWMDVEVQLNNSQCVYASNIFSRMLKSDSPSYAAYRSILLEDQPFAFAGDLVLTAVNTVGTTWGVHVQRVYGNQANEFTMVDVNKFIPALQPCATPSDCTIAANSCGTGRCRVAIPYSFDSTPWVNIPAVATDRFIFWITNPSMNMYQSVNHVCRQFSSGANAFQAESSYSSIQVWRMDPYEFCPIDPLTNTRRCPEDSSATFRTLPGFLSMNNNMKMCTQWFFVVAPTITYINQFNLALTVLNTTFMNVDTDTLRPVNASAARSVAPEIEPPRLKIQPHVGSSQDLPFFLLHLEMLEYVLLHLIETFHATEPSIRKRLDVREAFVELGLVALVRACDHQHRVIDVVREHLIRKHRLQLLQLTRHGARDELDLILAEVWDRLKLLRQRHWFPCLFLFDIGFPVSYFFIIVV